MIKECDEDLQHPPHHGYNECMRPLMPSSAAAEGRPRRKAHSGERLAQARLAGSSGRTTLLVDMPIKVAISRDRILTARSRLSCPRHLLSQTRPGPSILNRKRAFAATKARDHFLLCVPKFSYVPNRVEIQFAM